MVVRAQGPMRVFEISDADRSAVDNRGAGTQPLSLWGDACESLDQQQSHSALTSTLFGVSASISVDLASVGIAVIDMRPTELLYVFVKGLRVEYCDNDDDRRLAVGVTGLEINNQMADTAYPILLEAQRAEVPSRSSTIANSVVYFSMTLVNAPVSSGIGFYYVKNCELKVSCVSGWLC